jgi:hypothetical protein
MFDWKTGGCCNVSVTLAANSQSPFRAISKILCG